MTTEALIARVGHKVATCIVLHAPRYARCSVCHWSLRYGHSLIYRSPNGAVHCDGCAQPGDTARPL